MKCDEAELLLSPYLDGELPPDQQDAVAGHLAGCRACSLAWEKMDRISRMVREIDTPMVSPLLQRRVMAEIARQGTGTALLLSYASYLMVLAAAGTVLLSPAGGLLAAVARILVRNTAALLALFSRIPAQGSTLVWIAALLFMCVILLYVIRRLMVAEVPARRGDVGL